MTTPSHTGGDDVLDSFSLPESSSILVVGPRLTHKKRLMLSLVAGESPADHKTIVVSTRRPAARLEREFEALTGLPAKAHLDIVDATSVADVLEADNSPDNRAYVSSPGDLTGVGIELSEAMRKHQQQGSAARVGLHVLSTMVMYSDVKRVFQFLHVLTARIAATNLSAVFTLDTGFLEDSEIELLKQPFDAIVETRERDDRVQYRVRGIDAGPDTWTAFTP